MYLPLAKFSGVHVAAFEFGGKKHSETRKLRRSAWPAACVVRGRFDCWNVELLLKANAFIQPARQGLRSPSNKDGFAIRRRRGQRCWQDLHGLRTRGSLHGDRRGRYVRAGARGATAPCRRDH